MQYHVWCIWSIALSGSCGYLFLPLTVYSNQLEGQGPNHVNIKLHTVIHESSLCVCVFARTGRYSYCRNVMKCFKTITFPNNSMSLNWKPAHCLKINVNGSHFELMLVSNNFEDSTQSSERDSSTTDECTCRFILNSHKCMRSVGLW